jgi:hypothetical protein
MDVGSTIFETSASFSVMLYSRYGITVHLNQLASNFRGGNTIPHETTSHFELLCGITFPVSWLAHELSKTKFFYHLLHVTLTLSVIFFQKDAGLRENFQARKPCY